MTIPRRPDAVLITGATGLVGSHIARQYLGAGHAVSVLYRPQNGYGLLADVAHQITWQEGDILDIPSLEVAIQHRTRPDRARPDRTRPAGIDVIHAAAVVSFSPGESNVMHRVNVEGTANVVNVCLNAGVRKLGYVSSVAALGRPVAKGDVNAGQPIVIDEGQKWEESPDNSAYAKSKYQAELEVWRGVAEGLDAVMVCPSLVFGVGDWSRSSLQLVKYVQDERPFYPAGTANYVDVLDVAESMHWLMQQDTKSWSASARRYILNAGTIPYRDLLTNIATALGKRPPGTRMAPGLTRLLWPLEAVRAWMLGTPPLITRETARSASSHYRYDGHHIEQVADFQYRPLQTTLTRIAGAVGGQAGNG